MSENSRRDKDRRVLLTADTPCGERVLFQSRDAGAPKG